MSDRNAQPGRRSALRPIGVALAAELVRLAPVGVAFTLEDARRLLALPPGDVERSAA